MTAEQGLEGVVAKRLDAPWVEGRRSDAWVKQKHRRRERYVVSGWVPGEQRRPDEFLIARLDGKPAGRVSFGLAAGERSRLRAALAGGEARRGRGRVLWVDPVVEVEVDARGAEGGPVRDPVLRSWRFRA